MTAYLAAASDFSLTAMSEVMKGRKEINQQKGETRRQMGYEKIKKSNKWKIFTETKNQENKAQKEKLKPKKCKTKDTETATEN